MGQTTYTIDHDAAVAGQIASNDDGHGTRGRYECSENLNFGTIVELHTDGKLRAPQTAGASGKLLGAVAYNPVLPPVNVAGTWIYGYSAGSFMVPVFRRGQIWLEYVGTAPTVEGPVNVMSSSTVATDRGKVTGDATSAVAGSEIYALAGAVCIEVNAALGLALVEFNLP